MQLETNKESAIAFYKMAFKDDPSRAVKTYVGDRYIQHNPSVKDGKEGFITYFDRMQREYPDKSVNFVRASPKAIWLPCTRTGYGRGMKGR